MPIGWELAAANLGERVVAAEMLDRIPVAGHVVIADKGFAGAEFEQLMTQAGATFLRPTARTNRTATAASAPCANGSIRPFGPARDNSASNTTAPALSPDTAPASASDCSPSPPASGTTTSPPTRTSVRCLRPLITHQPSSGGTGPPPGLPLAWRARRLWQIRRSWVMLRGWRPW